MDLWVLKTDSNGSMEWMTIIADDPNNRGEKIIQTSDGGYAIAGTGTDVRQNGPVLFIFRLDKYGHILPNISMGKSPDYGSSIAVAPDNGYVVASYSGILFRVDENGTVLWSTPFHEGHDWGMVISVPEGGYAVTAGNRVVRINENGSIAWTAISGNERNTRIIIAEPEGGFVTGGTADAEVWIARFNTNGGILFTTTFQSISPPSLYSIRITPAGSYEILYGSSAYRGNERSGIWIFNNTKAAITRDGRVVWERPVNLSSIITATHDGGYAYSGFVVPDFTGLRQQGNPGSPLHLVRTDAEGIVTLDVFYDVGDHSVVSSVIQTDDGGFAIMGR